MMYGIYLAQRRLISSIPRGGEMFGVPTTSRNIAARGRMILISVNSPGWVSTSIEPLDFGTEWAQA
jgi:hypothetical protein